MAAALVLAVLAPLFDAGAAEAKEMTVPPEHAWIHPVPTVRHGPTDRPRIALTFDDNYQKPQAFETLRVLREHDVPATVFVIGHYAELGPGLVRGLAEGGFEIGDHTRSHANTPTLSWKALGIEIGDGTRTFAEITGEPAAPLFRPPGGFTNEYAATAAAAQGFRYVVLWDVDPQDWRGASAASIRDTVLGNAHNGAIVLLHLAAPHTAEALPSIIRGLRDRGYELVTVTELLKGGRRFADVDPATAEGTTILSVVEAGYLDGVDGDFFGPFDSASLADLAGAAVRATGSEGAGEDGPASATDPVAAAVAVGLVDQPRPGDGTGTPVDRLALARTLARMAHAKGYAETEAARYTDVPEADRDDVGLVVSLGLMNAGGADTFGVEGRVERRHLATVLARFAALPAAGGQAVAGTAAAAGTDEAPVAGLEQGAWPLSPVPAPVWALAAMTLVVAAALAALRGRAVRRRERAVTARRGGARYQARRGG